MKLVTVSLAVSALLAAAPLFAEDAKAETTDIKGEVIDLTCYLDHGAAGEKHSKCATKCIESGLPVGLKAADGTVYLVVGEHQPLNKELAAYAGKAVTLRGKVASRDGLHLLENATVVQ